MFKVKSEFTQNVLTLMKGTVIAQIIPIAVSPILTRMYTPEDFGLLALYMSILMILAGIASGKYELAILIPKSDGNAKIIVAASVLLALLISIILFFLIISNINLIVMLLGNQEIENWLYILPLNIFMMSMVTILYYWNNRKKAYQKLSSYQIIQSATQAASNILIGLFTKISSGMIIGTFLGGLFSLVYLIRGTKNDFKDFRFHRLRALVLLRRYIKFPKFIVPSSLLENISAQLPIILLGTYFGSAVVGFYFLSQKLVKIPIALIGTSIGNVFRQAASEELAKTGNCRSLFIRTFRKLFLIGTLPFIVFYFIAPMLFALVFGDEWRVAGEYTQILIPMFYLQFLTRPLANMFIIAEKQEYDLMMQIYLLISVAFSFYIGATYFKTVEASLYIFVVFYSIKYILELIMSYTFTIKRIK